MAKTPSETSAGIERLAAKYLDRHAADAARVIEHASPRSAAELLSKAPTGRARGVIRLLTPSAASEVLAKMDVAAAGRVLAELEVNRAAALLAGMSRAAQEERLASLAPELSEELRELMAYPRDCAGHLMDPRVATFRGDANVRDVVRRLRAVGARRVQDVFIVDSDDHLLASVSILDVLLAEGSTRLDSLVQGPPASVPAFASREEVVEALEQRRARSLPVVDFDGRILGVLRQDEIVAATAEAATADLVSMVGASKDERALSPPHFAIRKRLPWLQINLLTAFLAASVVGLFEGTIARFTALAVLLPVVAGQSGNTGAQALAVTMRGLALREVRLSQWSKVAAKETIVGIANGVAVALTTAAAVFVWSRSWGLALVIAVSMIVSMTAAGFAGAVIPLILTRLRQDPAQSSSIILTTVTDVVGFFSFLGIATLLASML